MRVLLLAIALATLGPGAFAQTTWYVDLNATPPGDGSQANPYPSIQQAVSAGTTLDGDTILVAPGEYYETVDLLGKSLVLRSTGGPLATILRPANPSDPVLVTMAPTPASASTATLEGFTLRRDPPSTAFDGFRIPISAQGILRRCIVTGHRIGVDNRFDGFLLECTITRNVTGVSDGSGLAIHEFVNTICWGNTTRDVLVGGFSGIGARYSDIGGLAGLFCISTCVGSFDTDPLFWKAVAGDFHLRPGSPCIDTGVPTDPLDPDGTRIDVGALTYDPFWVPNTSTSCFGDALACPCGNAGSGLGGCDNFQATGGFVLQVMNYAPNGAGGGTAQFLGTGYPPAAAPGSTLIRSPTLEVPPVVFGDGLRCISTAGLVRVGATVASGGASLHAINHGAGAGTFHYQVWVRSNPATFCNPQAFNLSNAVSVPW